MTEVRTNRSFNVFNAIEFNFLDDSLVRLVDTPTLISTNLGEAEGFGQLTSNLRGVGLNATTLAGTLTSVEIVSSNGLSFTITDFEASFEDFVRLDANSSSRAVFSLLNGDDTLFGSDEDDLLADNFGNNVIFGGGGDDRIETSFGDGVDELHGGAGDDRLNSRGGADILFGDAGDDRLFIQIIANSGIGGIGVFGSGGEGNDSISGANHDDTLQGDAGSDTVDGGAGNDEISGGDGDDFLSARSGANTISGDDGVDNIFGGSESDTLRGGAGNDGIQGNSGDDLIDGGDGDDLLVGSFGNDTVLGGAGQDSILGSSGTDELYGNDGDDTLEGSFNDDFLAGGAGIDSLLGGQGNDTISGGSDGDEIDGGDGFDFVSFADADRRVQADLTNRIGGIGDAAGDTFVSVEGIIGTRFNDNIRGGNEDNAILAGNFSDRIFGRGGNDTLDGEGGADAIYGNSGADEMTGGGGRDRFIYFVQSETGVGEGNRDVITDFDAAAGERMEIRRFDADTTQGFRQAFDFIGADAFSNTAGELRFDQSSGLNTIVQADTNGDGLADFEIELTGVITLTEANFLI